MELTHRSGIRLNNLFMRTPKELGTENVGKLLITYAVPAVIAMTASSLYNMVDSIFIGRGVGPLAISGLAVTFPFMNLSAAFGAAIGVGGATLMSVKLGQKDNESAVKVLGNVVTLNILVGIIFAAVTLPFLDPILRFFGASDNTVGYAHEYMFIILIGNAVTHLYLGLNSALRALGHPRKAMNATIATVVINTILDPIFIYGFKLGIAGAAYATVIAQVIALVYVLVLLADKNEYVHLQKGIYRLRKNITSKILTIGLSPFCMQTCSCLVVILINTGFKKYGGDLAIGAYGIVNRILFIFLMIVMGICQGMQPIAGFNYGAKQFDRVNEVLKKSITLATIVMCIGFIVAEFCPTPLVRLFTTDDELTRLSVEGMRIDAALFPLVGFQIVTGNFFQSIGLSKTSIIISLTRQLIFLVPLLIYLPTIFGTRGVWYSLPASDFLAVAVAGFYLMRFYKKGAYNNAPDL